MVAERLRATALRALAAIFVTAGVETGFQATAAEPVEVRVYPAVRRTIAGVGELDRNRYFAMCDDGRNFPKRMRPDGISDYLLTELNATFGRSLGPISTVTRGEAVREDPNRPGFVDLDRLREACSARRWTPSDDYARLMNGRLNVASHGRAHEFPEFLGEYTTTQGDRDNKKHRHRLPKNLDAAAELSVVALDAGYSDFDRPAYYEPINEPHWSFITTDQLADWHTKTHAAMKDRGVPVRVGGPCLSVAYFYRNGFRAFDGLQQFIEKTDAGLDFYSFHVYDYVNWDGSNLVGRVTSGLPIEGVLDFVQTYANNVHGKSLDLVVSEHGGYISGSRGRPDSEALGKLLVGERDGLEGFELTMRQRGVASHVLVSAAIGNTLAFMEHPHVVKKAVPFILPESMAWDPEYYSTMYVPHGFEDRSRWIETANSDFFKFFRDVSGHRVYARNGDPDLQVRAFVDGSTVRVVMNNVSDAAHTVRLAMPVAESFSVRRYGRNDDFTPYLREAEADPNEPIDLAGREAVVVVADYGRPVPTRKLMSETPRYSQQTAQAAENGKAVRFVVNTPDPDSVVYAELRIAVSRPTNASPEVSVRVNGKRVRVPVEDAAGRYDDGEKEYASTKLVALDPALLRATNRIGVSFPDGEPGVIGSVVIRTGEQRSAAKSSVAFRP
ncbi:beta-agarase [Botrimarina hoheduenensis]|uniref:Beta-porphyranase A n=1 Tax=Botrimarina hoheduenensis TaxID=2528000 RepID=A0A5C5VPU0_9BACT|nr:beta-agarase [Botrimarina hoheduenensis]TWT40658.1 Beta-porphyranase A precursor [Botrimarina hoheduenensis]